MSGFSTNDVRNIIKGAIAPDFRKLICAVQESGMEVIKYCDADGMVVGYLVPQYTQDGTVEGQFYDIEFTPLPAAPAGSTPCSSEGFTTSTIVMEDLHAASPSTLTAQTSVAINAGAGAGLIQTQHVSSVGENLVSSVIATYPEEAPLSAQATGYQPNTAARHQIRVELNRAFTGIVKLTSSGTALGSKQMGYFSENLGEVVNRTNGTSGSDGWYDHTNDTTDMVLEFYVEDCHYFSYAIQGGTIITSYIVEFEETKTKFIREITNDGGTYTVNDLNIADPTTAYTVQGDVAVWEEADTSLPYSDEVIGWDPNPSGANGFSAAIQNGVATLAVSSIAYADNIRSVNVQIEENTRCSVALLLHDGTTITHQMFGGSYYVELQLNQPPISSVTVTELDGIATRAIINTLSKTRF